MATNPRGARAMARYIVKGVELNVELYNETATQTLVLLHGFTGSTKTWQHVIEQLPATIKIVAVDLIGHGQTAAPSEVQPYTMQSQIELLDQLFNQLRLTRFILLGYSMGGRVALSYAVSYPKRIEQVILESASPGLELTDERMARKEADDLLAQKIETNGIDSFVDKWENISLFTSQKSLPLAVQQEIRAERLAQREIGLANSLRGMGTGVMPSLWDKLTNLVIPVMLITGTLDTKFVQLAKKMQSLLPTATHILVNNVGHAIHVENPTKFATIVKETISSTI